MKIDIFLEQLSATNYTLDNFVNFDKVIKNVNKISIKLNQLNYLIGKTDIKNAIKELFSENEKCFSVLNILIAVRKNQEILPTHNNPSFLKDYFSSPENIYLYIKETGLESVFKDKEIKNLVDYVFGIEVGLDTNARKNRNGQSMSDTVSSIFKENNINFDKEIRSTEFQKLKSLGADIKQFDFVVKTKQKTYLIEVNYYNGGGSKLNETARSYSDIAPKINQYTTLEFVWITDGQGWFSAKNKLSEALNIIPKVYNLKTIEDFIEIIKND